MLEGAGLGDRDHTPYGAPGYPVPVTNPPIPDAERLEIMADAAAWYAANARDLPWRRPGTTPWGVLVSEVMSQQTPVARVVGPWLAWLDRWPTPTALADDDPREAVAAWGRLGYPQRALRLHAAAVAIRDTHDGRVPDTVEALEALPGVGRYTAAAVASFAFGAEATVLDTNVRRVLVRIEDAAQFPPSSTTTAEWRRATAWRELAGVEGYPEPAVWAVASMEIGAVVCRAADPACDACPLHDHCRWLAAGRPDHDGPPRRTQAWHGTDRQCRGVLLDAVRTAHTHGLSVDVTALLTRWPLPDQSRRCLDSLLADGLVHRDGDGVTL